MKFNSTPLPGVIHIELDAFRDPRGYFLESFQQQKYADGGIKDTFVQDNLSHSSKGTLRGLHAQFTHPQAKLIHVIAGDIFDCVVDIRPASPTYKRWYGVRLSSEKPSQLYVPAGYAHGFCVLSDDADVLYKCTDFYDPKGEIHLRWDDPEIGIAWPIQNPLLSDKDQKALSLRQIESKLVELTK